MRRAVAEEYHPAGLQFDRLGFGFIRLAVDVMVAVAVALVRQERFVSIGYDAQRAIRHGGVVDRDPHGGSAERLGNLEVSVVLVPRGAHAGLPGFQENLVEMQRNLGADQFCHGGDDLGRKRQRADERAVEIRGAELEVDLLVGRGLAVASARDISEKPIALESRDVGLERGGLLGVEKTGHGNVAAAAKLLNLSRRKFHGWGRAPYQADEGLTLKLWP